MQVRKVRAGTEVTLDAGEADVLTETFTQLLSLLGPEEADEAGEVDPLVALVGLSVDAERPTDPALARLLPDAYPDDEEAASEFRRYTEADLRAAKRAQARTVLGGLAGGTTVLDRDAADAWIGSLNDLRLVLGTRLGVQQDGELAVEADTPEAYALGLYELLGWLQDAILRTISPR